MHLIGREGGCPFGPSSAQNAPNMHSHKPCVPGSRDLCSSHAPMSAAKQSRCRQSHDGMSGSYEPPSGSHVQQSRFEIASACALRAKLCYHLSMAHGMPKAVDLVALGDPPETNETAH